MRFSLRSSERNAGRREKRSKDKNQAGEPAGKEKQTTTNLDDMFTNLLNIQAWAWGFRVENLAKEQNGKHGGIFLTLALGWNHSLRDAGTH